MDLIIIFTMGLALATLIIASRLSALTKKMRVQQLYNSYLISQVLLDQLYKKKNVYVRCEKYEQVKKIDEDIRALRRAVDKYWELAKDGNK